jgi:hypothetical protein
MQESRFCHAVDLRRMSKRTDNDTFDEAEAQKRFEAALRGALKSSPKPLKEKPKVRKAKKAKVKKDR